jgi:hypothetical protein
MKRHSLGGDIWLKLDAFRSFAPFDVGYPVSHPQVAWLATELYDQRIAYETGSSMDVFSAAQGGKRCCITTSNSTTRALHG